MEQMETQVWPENWSAFTLFARVRSQWLVGMSGPTGLRYEAVYPLIDRAATSPEEWDDLFADIQTLESAALEAISAT